MKNLLSLFSKSLASRAALRKQVVRLAVFAAALSALPWAGWAQPNTVRTRLSGALNWSSPSTWIKTCTGTLSTNGGTVVTGSGTNFLTELSPGSQIMALSSPDYVYTVASIQSATSLTLTASTGWSGSGVTFGVQKLPSATDTVEIGSYALPPASTTVTFDLGSASIGGLRVIADLFPNVLTHSGTGTLNIGGYVDIQQPDSTATNAWNINAATVNVGGSVTLSSLTTTANCIRRITLTTGTLDIGGDLVYQAITGASASLAVVDMSTGASTLRIGGSLTYSGALLGTLSPGSSSTVVFDGTGAQNIWVGSSITYRNITINKTAGTASLAAALDLAGNFLIQQGTFATAGLTFTVRGTFQNSGTCTTASGTITYYGSFVNNGIYTPGTSTVQMRGSTNQVISGSNSTLNLYNLTFNRTAGAVTFSGIAKVNARALSVTLGSGGTVAMPDSVVLTSSVTLTSGTYTSGSALVVAGSMVTNAPFVHSNGAVVFNGSGNQTISGSVLPTFHILRVAKSSSSYTLTANSNINVANTLDISTTTSIFAAAAAVVVNSSAAAATLTGSGAIRCYRIAATADFVNQFKFSTLNLSALRVEYLGAGAQTVNTLAYSALTIGGTGTKTAAGSLSGITALTVANNVGFDLGSYTLAGTLTTVSNSGRIRTQNTTASALPSGKNWGDSVEYYASAGGHNVISGTYATLVLPGAGTQVASGALTVNTVLVLPASTVLNMQGNALAGTLTTMSGTGTIRTQNTSTTPITASKTWPYAIEFNAATGGQSIPAGTYGTLTCSHTSGTTTAVGSFTVNTLFSSTATGGIVNTGAYTVTVKGNFSVAGSMAGTGTLLFNGTVAQTLTAGGSLYNLTINKSGTTVTLGGNLTVAGTVTFTLGSIVTGSYWLHSTSGTFAGAGQSTGWVVGSVRRNFSSSITSGSFPVGGANYYAPVTIALTGVSAPGNITAASPEAQHPNILTSNILTTHNIPRYWTVASSGGLVFSTYAATLNWNSAQNYAGLQPAGMSVARYSSGSWYTTTVGGTPTTTQIQSTNNAIAGDFIVGDSCSVSASIAYAGGPFAPSGTVNVTHTGDGGGTYSGTSGLSVNSSTGQVDLTSSTPGFHTVSYTIPAGSGCGTYVTTAPVHIYNTCTWTGGSSTAWTTTSNWNPASIPAAHSKVVVPTGLTNYPIVSSGTALGYEFSLAATNSITVATGATLKIGGPVSGAGKITATAGTVQFVGTAAQTVAANRFTSNEVLNLVCGNELSVTLAGTLIVSGSLKVADGALNTGGFLTLKSTPTRTAFIDGTGAGPVNGAVNMQRYLPSRYGYKYISSPFSNATVAQLSQECDLAASFPRLYRNEEDAANSGWEPYTTTTLPLNVAEGYAANVGAAGGAYTMEMTGTVNDGPISFPVLTHHNQPYTQGFNLVGNPYPSPINWDAAGGWTRTNVDNAIYYFNPSTTNQYTGTYTSYVNGVSNQANATGIIAAMQGFFVHVTNGAYPVTGSIEVNNAARTTTSQAYYHKQTANDDLRIRLSARFEESDVTDGAVLYYTEEATPVFDRAYDALKMLNTEPSVPNLYWRGPDAEKMSIYATAQPTGYRGASNIYALAVECAVAGWTRIAAEELKDLPAGVTAYLADATTGEVKTLAPGLFHRAYLDKGTHADRFYLVLSEESSFTLPWREEEAPVYAAEGAVFVFGAAVGAQVEILNAVGQSVYRQTLTGSGFQRIETGLPTGVYIVMTADSVGKRKAKKVFIEPRP